MGGQEARREPPHPPEAQGEEVQEARRRERHARHHTRPREHRAAAQGGGRKEQVRRHGDRPRAWGKPQEGAADGQRHGDKAVVDSAARWEAQRSRGGRRGKAPGAVQGAAAHRDIRQWEGVRQASRHGRPPGRDLIQRTNNDTAYGSRGRLHTPYPCLPCL